MRKFQPSSLGLSGSLLIAHPNLLDPNFRRTILFMVANEPGEGSYGLILNRRSGKSVGEVIQLTDPGPLGEIPVFHGGPVGTDRLTFAAFRWDAGSESLECRANLELDEARDLTREPGTVVRAFAGYAGWSAGQLEHELQAKAWVVQKPGQEILDPEQCQNLWTSIIREFGPWFRLLAEAPDDPSLN
ncbi:MAG TPA: YqgE/AlgH family protein [Chthoniobacteraceae bacterium]|nr:YqgE/AlgH family protein [Chthoniobacteraceae bacterium]